jgi:hypothetical protein
MNFVSTLGLLREPFLCRGGYAEDLLALTLIGWIHKSQKWKVLN